MTYVTDKIVTIHNLTIDEFDHIESNFMEYKDTEYRSDTARSQNNFTVIKVDDTINSTFYD